jgi:hypothetical protein
MALVYPEKDSRLPGYATFTVYNGNGGREGPQIVLPLPQGLTYQDAASYENADLGLKGLAVVSPRDGQEETTNTSEAATADNPNKKSIGQKALEDIAIRFGGNLGRAGVGSAPNPNTRAIFKQINMRTFQVAYKMLPTSPREADTCKDIVEAFRTELYPEAEGYSENFITAFKFPNLFRIRFYVGGIEQKPKLLDAYLTNMTTTYNSSTNAILAKDGGSFSFSEIDISMTFLEFRALFKDDIKQGR